MTVTTRNNPIIYNLPKPLYIVECASVKCYFPVQTCFMNIFLKCNTVSYFKAYIFHNDLASPHFHPNPSIG